MTFSNFEPFLKGKKVQPGELGGYSSLYINKKQLIEILSEVDKYFHISETQYGPKLLNLILKVQQL
jgi:hypothetical protein